MHLSLKNGNFNLSIYNMIQKLNIHIVMDRFPIYIIFLVTLFLCSLTSTKAGIIVLNGLTHEDSAQPGESYRGSIKIQNTGKSAKSVRVY